MKEIKYRQLHTDHSSNHDDFWTKLQMNEIQLEDSQVEYDKADGVDISCPLEVVVVCQYEPQDDGECQ